MTARLVALLAALGLSVSLLAPTAEAKPRRLKTFVSIQVADASVLVGQQVTVRGRVQPYKKMSPRFVKLQARVDGSWQKVRTGHASKWGRYSFTFTASRAGAFDVRVAALGTKRAKYGVSKTARLVVSLQPSRVTASYPGGSAKRGTAKAVTGAVAPVGSGRTLALQRQVPGTWRTLSTTTTTTGRYRLPVPTGVLGRWRLRVVAVPTASYAAAESRRPNPFEITPDWEAEGRGSDHTFLGSQVRRWNPCGVIRYRVNTRYAPRGALADVKQAVRRTTLATGLRFEYAGSTRIMPQKRRQSFDGAELVIAWGSVKQSSWLAQYPDRTTAGVGGASLVYTSGYVDGAGRTAAMSVQGKIVLNTRFNRTIKGGAGTGPTRVSLLMHEIGHVVGADHAKGKPQIMYPSMTSRADWWGRGDITGLRRLGTDQGCFYRAGSQPGARSSARVVVPELVDGRPEA